MKKVESNIIVGTSYFGVSIFATARELEEALWTPKEGDGFKTEIEWHGQLKDGTPFTIYDWMEGKIDKDFEIEWHIGGFTKLGTLKALEEINKRLGR